MELLWFSMLIPKVQSLSRPPSLSRLVNVIGGVHKTMLPGSVINSHQPGWTRSGWGTHVNPKKKKKTWLNHIHPPLGHPFTASVSSCFHPRSPNSLPAFSSPALQMTSSPVYLKGRPACLSPASYPQRVSFPCESKERPFILDKTTPHPLSAVSIIFWTFLQDICRAYVCLFSEGVRPRFSCLVTHLDFQHLTSSPLSAYKHLSLILKINLSTLLCDPHSHQWLWSSVMPSQPPKTWHASALVILTSLK